MDFIEFLQSGSRSSIDKIVFDEKIFRKESDKSLTGAYFKLNGSQLRERGYAYSGYTLSKFNRTITSGNPYFEIYRNGQITDYQIELENGYAVLTMAGVYVGASDDLKKTNGQSIDREDSDGENTSISSYSSYDDGGFGRAIFSILFPPFILIWSFLKEYENYYFKKWAYMLGSFICGGESVFVVSFFGFLEHNTDILGVFSVYAATFFISLTMLCFSKHIGSKFKSAKQIVVFSVIYSIVFVAALVVVPIILSRFM